VIEIDSEKDLLDVLWNGNNDEIGYHRLPKDFRKKYVFVFKKIFIFAKSSNEFREKSFYLIWDCLARCDWDRKYSFDKEENIIKFLESGNIEDILPEIDKRDGYSMTSDMRKFLNLYGEIPEGIDIEG